jgi:NhaA family Na+:H+ antiporter
MPLQYVARAPGGTSPLRSLEHDLHPVVAYAILPMFAFANAGVSLRGLSLAAVFEPLPLGIVMGLVAGKLCGVFELCGVFGMSALAIRTGMARMPEGAGWGALPGVSLLCGIGFTMRLFITSLAFGDNAPQQAASAVLGVLVGSLIAGVAGYLVLRFTIARPDAGAG